MTYFYYINWILDRNGIATCFCPLILHKRLPRFNQKLPFRWHMSTTICTLSLTGCCSLLNFCIQQSILDPEQISVKLHYDQCCFLWVESQMSSQDECTNWLSVRKNIPWWPNNSDNKATILCLSRSTPLKLKYLTAEHTHPALCLFSWWIATGGRDLRVGDSLLPRSGGGCLEVGLPAPTLLPLGPGSVTLIEGREMNR